MSYYYTVYNRVGVPGRVAYPPVPAGYRYTTVTRTFQQLPPQSGTAYLYPNVPGFHMPTSNPLPSVPYPPVPYTPAPYPPAPYPPAPYPPAPYPQVSPYPPSPYPSHPHPNQEFQTTEAAVSGQSTAGNGLGFETLMSAAEPAAVDGVTPGWTSQPTPHINITAENCDVLHSPSPSQTTQTAAESQHQCSPQPTVMVDPEVNTTDEEIHMDQTVGQTADTMEAQVPVRSSEIIAAEVKKSEATPVCPDIIIPTTEEEMMENATFNPPQPPPMPAVSENRLRNSAPNDDSTSYATFLEELQHNITNRKKDHAIYQGSDIYVQPVREGILASTVSTENVMIPTPPPPPPMPEFSQERSSDDVPDDDYISYLTFLEELRAALAKRKKEHPIYRGHEMYVYKPYVPRVEE